MYVPDAGEPPVVGLGMALYPSCDESWVGVSFATTDSNGDYTFTGLDKSKNYKSMISWSTLTTPLT